MDLKTPAAVRILEEPKVKRKLTTREKILILEGSKLHETTFPPWSTASSTSEFDQCASFQDDVNCLICQAKTVAISGWQRCHEINGRKLISTDEGPEARSTYGADLDLVQDMTTDCSVVASLCAIVSRIERGFPNLFASIFHPWDEATKVPGVSANGKYIFRFYFNGSYRKVVIDDRLPTSKTGRRLYVVDRNKPSIIWPALIEKAYLKVRGGYNFPGSNSGTDLWVLTGWLPEQLFLQSDDLDRYALWRKLLKAFEYGDVLITIGTGPLSQKEERGLGLIGEHDYAVIDVREHNGQRLFLVKNPWLEGAVWKGYIRCTDDVILKSKDCHFESRPQPTLRTQESLGLGTFWIDLDNVFQNFESIYLNWNPGLFLHREDIHFVWDLTEHSSPKGCFRVNPQYSISSDSGGTVWLLLSRHFACRRDAVTSSKDHPDLSHVDQGFISIYCFSKNGRKVLSSEGYVTKSQYVDSPNTLLKVQMPPLSKFTIVISQQSLLRTRHTFTLSALSSAAVELALAQSQYMHTWTQEGRWTALSAGGNAGSSLYYTNPQYRIEIFDKSSIAIVLESTSASLPVHVKLVWAAGEIVRSITTKDILGDSGEHTIDLALLETEDIPAGRYTLVCSTFEKGQVGEFKIHVFATAKFDIQRIPIPGAGRFIAEIKTARFPSDIDRLSLPLVTRRINRISVNVCPMGNESTLNKSARSPMKVSVEVGRGPMAQVLAVSGDGGFIDVCTDGAFIRDINIEPRMCASFGIIVALERLVTSSSSYEEEIAFDIQSDEPVELGQWISQQR